MLDVPIDAISQKEAANHILAFLSEPKFHRIATVNPEFLLLAEQDPAFRQALVDADLRIADGFGIVLASLMRGRCIARFPGADLMEEILSIANERKLSVYLAVRADGLSSYEEVRSAISEKYPGIIIDGADIDTSSHASYVMPLTSSIVLCNFGAPHQELFLADLKNNPGNIRLAIGIGGSFDYLTGKLRRAPRWIRAIGLEWLWRLILQPKRWKRIYNAIIVFPLKALLAHK